MLTADHIRKNYEAALEVAGRFFMGEAPVQLAARRITRALRDLGVPHVVCGGLAVAAHGHLRLTQDVDILVTPEGLRRFKERWLGRGWVERFAGSRGLRDAEHGIQIDVLLTGDFPGDGQPGPVAFPDPEECAVESGGVSVISLSKLIELKIASGLSAPSRLQDWADVIALVRANDLREDYAQELNPHVRQKYAELWALAQATQEDR
jgi:hypothetical protein